MQPLTGTTDTDVQIIKSLNLDDLRNFCQMNQSASNLCHTNIDLQMKIKSVKDKVNHILTLKKYEINTNEKFLKFHLLLDHLHISTEDEYDEMLLTSTIDNYNIFGLLLIKKKLYHLIFNIGYWENDLYRQEETIKFECTKEQMREFLLHIYYDRFV